MRRLRRLTVAGRRLGVAALVLLTAGAPRAATAQTPAAAWHELERRFRAEVTENGIVGASLWLLHGDRVIGRAFHGFADLETGRRVDEHTIFHWASITKTFTGIAILQLRDRGLLALDDPVVRWIPELREVHSAYGPIDRVTVRHLLTHTAGFRAGTWPWGGDRAWHPHEPTRWEQLAAMFPYTELLFEPGSRYAYSNPGIVFLGRIIERITGDDYEVHVDKNILKPLGMHRSYFDTTPYHLLPYRSNSYAVRDGRPVALGLDFDTGITVSNGGLNAPVPDMARYLAFLTGASPDAALREVVLARSTLEEMWTPVVPLGSQPVWGDADESMGLTFFVLERPGRRIVGHTGSQRSFLSFFYVDPATGAAAIGAFNTDGTGPDRTPDTRALMNRLRRSIVEDVLPVF